MKTAEAVELIRKARRSGSAEEIDARVELILLDHAKLYSDQQNKEKDAEIQRLTKELQEAKTSDGRGWKAVERLQRANDVLRNENDKLKDQLIILKKAYGSKKTNNA